MFSDVHVYKNLTSTEKEKMRKCLNNLLVLDSSHTINCHHVSCNLIKKFLPHDRLYFEKIKRIYELTCLENCFANLTKNLMLVKDNDDRNDNNNKSRDRCCDHEFVVMKAIMFYVDNFEEIVLRKNDSLFEDFCVNDILFNSPT